jgi:RNA polymerase sigma-70 factor, ECF subfamily
MELPLSTDRSPSPYLEPDAARDAALVDRVRAGDEAAFETMFRQHAGRLLDFAYGYTGAKDDAEDVVQAVFAKLWLARERWELRGPLGAYLMLAVRNEVRDRAKHDGVVARHATRGRQAQAPSGDEEFEANETGAAIQVAIHALAPQRRAVCILRWAHGLSYAEIARALNLAPKTVERHLALAYKELRTKIPNLPRLG